MHPARTATALLMLSRSKIETLKKEADDLLAQIKALDAEEIEN